MCDRAAAVTRCLVAGRTTAASAWAALLSCMVAAMGVGGLMLSLFSAPRCASGAPSVCCKVAAADFCHNLCDRGDCLSGFLLRFEGVHVPPSAEA